MPPVAPDSPSAEAGANAPGAHAETPLAPAKPLSLAEHLARCYREHHGLGDAGACNALARALAADADLAAAARQQLDQLHAIERAVGGDLAKRCILSHTARESLTRALATLDTGGSSG